MDQTVQKNIKRLREMGTEGFARHIRETPTLQKSLIAAQEEMAGNNGDRLSRYEKLANVYTDALRIHSSQVGFFCQDAQGNIREYSVRLSHPGFELSVSGDMRDICRNIGRTLNEVYGQINAHAQENNTDKVIEIIVDNEALLRQPFVSSATRSK